MQGLIVNTILFDLNLAAFSIYYDFQKRHTNAYMEVGACCFDEETSVVCVKDIIKYVQIRLEDF